MLVDSFSALIEPGNIAWMVILGWMILPILSIIFLHSVLYDAWRHMFFIFPAMVLISVFGLREAYGFFSGLSTQIWLPKILLVIVLAVGLFEPLSFNLKFHPHENTYFNFLAGKFSTLREKYDQDYWGLSYKQGINYLLSKIPSGNIRLAVNDDPGENFIRMGLTQQQSSRINIVPIEQSKYFITTFRGHPEDYEFGNECYSINIRGTKILAIYEMD